MNYGAKTNGQLVRQLELVVPLLILMPFLRLFAIDLATKP